MTAYAFVIFCQLQCFFLKFRLELSFPFFIARRFFRNIGADRRSASNPTITIATAGVAVGLAVMIVTVSVIAGFKREITTKVSGFSSDIEVLDYRSLASPEAYPITADSVFVRAVSKWPGIKSVHRVGQKMGILKTDSEFQGVSLKGLPAGYDTSFISRALVKGRLPRLDAKPNHETGAVGSNEIALSTQLAANLGLKVGDRVFAYFFEETIKMRRLRVVGLYTTNMGIFDKTFAVTDYATVAQLNSWNEDQCSSLEVRLADSKRLSEAMSAANEYCASHPDPTAVPRRPLSVREHYAQVFSWLDLLDFNMVVILVLMLCVAGFTMISGLLILILERTQTIGVLKALGATNSRVRSIFLHFSALITLRGLLIGDLLALGLIYAQQRWSLVHLDPASYYVETVPVTLNWLPILLLNVGTLLITILALVGPSYVVSRIQPAKAIRYE